MYVFGYDSFGQFCENLWDIINSTTAACVFTYVLKNVF